MSCLLYYLVNKTLLFQTVNDFKKIFNSVPNIAKSIGLFSLHFICLQQVTSYLCLSVSLLYFSSSFPILGLYFLSILFVYVSVSLLLCISNTDFFANSKTDNMNFPARSNREDCKKAKKYQF